MSDKGFPNLPKSFIKKQVDDCERPACHDTVAAINASLSRLQPKEGKTQGTAVECPPDSPQLGKSSWNLLHTMVGLSERNCEGVFLVEP
jgi:hypothetical protein